MDTATLFAFAATFPEAFQSFMRGASEHVVLDGDWFYGQDDCSRFIDSARLDG